ncbi:serine hydrolase [bacterium]|nr:serine hydrolase [bacterium]
MANASVKPGVHAGKAAAHGVRSRLQPAIDLQPVSEVIHTALQERVFPGCTCVIAQSHTPRENSSASPFLASPTILFREAFGHFSFSPLVEEGDLTPVTNHTVYDVDSLTSFLVTIPLVMKAIEQHRIQLTDRVSRHVHGFGVSGKSPIRIIDLLRHESGLSASEPFYQEVGSLQRELRFGTPVGRGVAQQVSMLINRLAAKTTVGSTRQYSEVEMILLGHLLELLWAKRIDKLAQQFLFQPLGIRGSGFIDHGLVRQGKVALDPGAVAPSEECPWRRRVLQGEVRDENTWAMGGISGEAGLFANSADITTLLHGLLGAFHGKKIRSTTPSDEGVEGRPLLSPAIVRHFLEYPADGREWGLGWGTCASTFGVTPPPLFQHSLGAVSPTGCAFWCDPEHSLSVVLLSNRTMPSRSNRKITSFWSKFFSTIWSSLLSG